MTHPTISADEPAFVLASGSPRRRELTARLGLVPRVQRSQLEEIPEPGEAPEAYARRLARQKAEDVARQLAAEPGWPGWVLAADTIVVRDDQILEKPADEADARRMLGELSGRAHQVVTAFCWWRRADDHHRVEAVTTEVVFRALDEATIARYVVTGEPMDKAGAYGIQGLGGALVERIEGSYSAVVGLPVGAVIAALEELGGLEGFPWSLP